MSYKNRGMFLENILNHTFKIYAQNNIGIFHKKTLPISFSSVSKNQNGKHKIINGWIETKSTTDYYGIFHGVFIALEAKSTKGTSWALANIKKHQLRYLHAINRHGGLGYLILGFVTYNQYFIIHPDQIEKLDKSSINLNQCEKTFHKINLIYPGILDLQTVLSKLIKKWLMPF